MHGWHVPRAFLGLESQEMAQTIGKNDISSHATEPIEDLGTQFQSRAEKSRFLKRCSARKLLTQQRDIGIIINPDNGESSFLMHFSSFSKKA
jgi:hypothetical protein